MRSSSSIFVAGSAWAPRGESCHRQQPKLTLRDRCRGLPGLIVGQPVGNGGDICGDLTSDAAISETLPPVPGGRRRANLVVNAVNGRRAFFNAHRSEYVVNIAKPVCGLDGDD